MTRQRRVGRRRPAHPLLTWCSCAVLALAGCAQSEEDRASAAVERYFDALGARDFAEACDLAHPDLRQTFVRFGAERLELQRASCEAVLERLADVNGDRLVRLQGEVEVESVEIDEDTARMQLSTEGQAATARRMGSGWRVSELDFSGATGRP